MLRLVDFDVVFPGVLGCQGEDGEDYAEARLVKIFDERVKLVHAIEEDESVDFEAEARMRDNVRAGHGVEVLKESAEVQLARRARHTSSTVVDNADRRPIAWFNGARLLEDMLEVFNSAFVQHHGLLECVLRRALIHEERDIVVEEAHDVCVCDMVV